MEFYQKSPIKSAGHAAKVKEAGSLFYEDGGHNDPALYRARQGEAPAEPKALHDNSRLGGSIALPKARCIVDAASCRIQDMRIAT